MASPGSLRDLYSTPSTSWSFVPPAPAGPQNSSTPSTSASSASVVPNPSTQLKWSSRPAHNSIFDLSPSLDPSDPTGNGLDIKILLPAALASAVLQYTSTALAMPWEVGRMLLQVQWVPRDAGEIEPVVTELTPGDESDDSSDTDSYFADPSAPAAPKHRPKRLVDDNGYVVRTSVMEDATRPEYIIPVGSADGVWGMIKRLGRFRGEGWLALWKGLLTSCIHDVLSTTSQPIVQNFLQSVFFPHLSPFHQPPIILPVLSHLVVGIALSPLDLIRTRLIVQSSISRHRTYSGPLDALSQILRHEGGLRGIYLHPHLFIPTVIDCTLRPLVALALPGLLASYVGAGHISEETHPIAWLMAEFAGSCLGLLITLPFETVRRRLQAQVRGTAKPIKACVELRPSPYNGVVDALWHIMTEERSDLPLHSKKRRRATSQAGLKGKEREKTPAEVAVVAKGDEHESWLRNTGAGQLYRGLGMRLSASVIVLLLGVLTGGQERDSGWAEL